MLTGKTYRCELAELVVSILGKRPTNSAATLPYGMVDHLVLEDNEKNREQKNHRLFFIKQIPFQSKIQIRKISELLRSEKNR